MNKNIKKSLKGGLNTDLISSADYDVSGPLLQQTNNAFSDVNKSSFNATSQINGLVPDTNNYISNVSQAREQIGQQVGEQVGQQVGQQAREQAREQVGEQVGESEGFIGEIANAVGDVESEVIKAEAKVTTTSAVAVADAVGSTIKNQGEKIMNAIKTTAKFGYNALNTVKKVEAEAEAEADVFSLEIAEDAKEKQIETLKEKGITEEQAEAEFEKIEEKREEDKKADHDAEVKIAEAAAATATALKLTEASVGKGGNKRRMTLSQIQKGGRQSAKRTKKSINDFFKSSVTSSQILKKFAKPDNKRKTIRKSKRRKHGRKSRKQKI